MISSCASYTGCWEAEDITYAAARPFSTAISTWVPSGTITSPP